MLHITSLTFNPFQENTYIIWSDQRNGWIIDPGCYDDKENKLLSSFLEENQIKPVKLFQTHCHIDHVTGNHYVFDKYGLKPEMHPNELALLQACQQIATSYGLKYIPSPEPEVFWKEGDEIELDGNSLELRDVSGHSPGSLCVINHEDKWAICGDAIFYGSIGRTDFPMCDHDLLIKNIKEKILTLPDEYTLYSGHGPETTVEREKRSNPFLK